MQLTTKCTNAFVGFEQWWVCVNGAKVLGPFASEFLAEAKIQAFKKKYLKGS